MQSSLTFANARFLTALRTTRQAMFALKTGGL